MSIAAITFDAYNTVLDFASGARARVRDMLAEFGVNGGERHVDAVLSTMNRVVVGRLDEFIGRTRGSFAEFVTLDEIHRSMFADVERNLIPGFDVDRATDSWNRYIAGVPLYDDAHGAVDWAAARGPTAIVSDIDTWMLAENPNVRSLPIRGMVTSQDDVSYKAMADCTMFNAAAKLLGCEPGQIVHVGDSSADVIGVQRAGGRAVWLNRNGATLAGTVPAPDAVISTLAQLPQACERL